MKLGHLLFLCLLITNTVHASKDKCTSLFTLGKHRISYSGFIPLNTFIESEKNVYAVRRFLMTRNAKSIGPGVAIMHRTAHEAALKVRNSLKISEEDVYTFGKPTGAPYANFAEVVKVMKQRKYKYIQNAFVLLPDKGIYTVLPLAEYDPVADTYVPIVIKGHQDLKKSDILTAAITSEAIGKYMGSTSPIARVSLRPIVPKRRSTDIVESEHIVKVANHNTNIEEIYENFIKEYLSFEKVLEEKPTEYFAKNPTATQEDYIREAITPLLEPQKYDITTMSYAPSIKQQKALSARGYTSKKEIAKIDLNSAEFMELAFNLNIAPYRLKHFILRSRSTVSGKILYANKIKDISKGLDYFVHLDIEGVLDARVKSGAYYFGFLFEPLNDPNWKLKKYTPNDKNPDKVFIGGRSDLTQEIEDELWVEVYKLLRNDKRLKNGKYIIPVYSPYEQAKQNQHLQILKDTPKNFTDEQKSRTITIKGIEYPLYKELDVYSPVPGLLGSTPNYTKKGYLIRRVEFFESHPEVNPNDTFNYLERLYDMLPHMRHDVVNPGKNNSIKTILPYAQEHLPADIERVVYAIGDNGLNAIAWYFHYLKTGDADYLERIRLYLEIDIDANSVEAGLLTWISRQNVEAVNKWSDIMLEQLNEALPLFVRNMRISNLRDKHSALKHILGKNLTDLTNNQLIEFATTLDRSAYLKKRKSIKLNRRYSPARKKSLYMRLKHLFESKRQDKLIKFLQKFNPNVNTDNMADKVQDLFYYFKKLPASQMSEGHINKMLMMEYLQNDVVKFAKENNMLPNNPKSFDLKKVKEYIDSPELIERVRKLKKKEYGILKYNELDKAAKDGAIREYGFGPMFEKYISVNMKAIWEGLLIEYLLGRGK